MTVVTVDAIKPFRVRKRCRVRKEVCMPFNGGDRHHRHCRHTAGVLAHLGRLLGNDALAPTESPLPDPAEPPPPAPAVDDALIVDDVLIVPAAPPPPEPPEPGTVDAAAAEAFCQCGRTTFVLLADGNVPILPPGEKLPPGTIAVCSEGDPCWLELLEPIPPADAGVTDKKKAADLRKRARKKLRYWGVREKART
jgi:hypothetical protein